MNWFKRNARAFSISIILALLIVAMTGCGTAATETKTVSSPPPANAPATASATQQAPTPAVPEKKDVKIGLPLKAATFLPIYIADVKGYFKDEGLNVSVFDFKGDADVVQALAGKSVDINVSSLTGLVNSIKAGQPFIATWGGFNQADFAWYSPKLKSFAEAKGARFGVSTYGALTDFLTRDALRKAGLDPEKDVGILQVGGSANSITAMESGQIDASALSTPYNFIAEDKGMNLILSERKDLSPTWPVHVVFARKDYVKENPNTMKAFLRAMVRGVEFIEKNPDEAANELTSRLKFEQKYSVRAVKTILPDYDKKGKVDQRGLDYFWKIAIESKDVDKAWTDDQWFDKSFINSVDQWMK